jgi:hypothetical protein
MRTRIRTAILLIAAIARLAGHLARREKERSRRGIAPSAKAIAANTVSNAINRIAVSQRNAPEGTNVMR